MKKRYQTTEGGKLRQTKRETLFCYRGYLGAHANQAKGKKSVGNFDRDFEGEENRTYGFSLSGNKCTERGKEETPEEWDRERCRSVYVRLEST